VCRWNGARWPAVRTKQQERRPADPGAEQTAHLAIPVCCAAARPKGHARLHFAPQGRSVSASRSEPKVTPPLSVETPPLPPRGGGGTGGEGEALPPGVCHFRQVFPYVRKHLNCLPLSFFASCLSTCSGSLDWKRRVGVWGRVRRVTLFVTVVTVPSRCVTVASRSTREDTPREKR